MSKAILILTMIMLGMFSCVAVVYREEIKDIQAYTSRPLFIDEQPGKGDLAP